MRDTGIRAGTLALLVDSVTGIETAEMNPVKEPPLMGTYRVQDGVRLVLDVMELERLCGI